MRQSLMPGLGSRWVSLLSAIVGCTSFSLSSLAQAPPVQFDATPPPTRYPQCQPPRAGEYLLLVSGSTAETQTRIRDVIPANTTAIVCSYREDIVTRVGGFSNIESANSWAQYLTEVTGLPTFVARPAESAPVAAAPSPTPSPSPAPAATPAATATPANSASLPYNPKPLGTGYAVLVNYFNRPEVAADVRQLLSRDVGLAVYGQRPYLLALYTSDQNQANSILQALSDRGFWAMVVDSRRVTLLRSVVAGGTATAGNP